MDRDDRNTFALTSLFESQMNERSKDPPMSTDARPAQENGGPAGPHCESHSTGSDRSPELRDEPISILLVDDEPKNLTVLETILSNASYRLVRAESADEALLALVVEEFALLVLDIQMPGMDGFELAQMIKGRKKTAGVPIIFLTAYYSEDQHVLEGYETGAVDYLHKPINPDILRSKVAVFAELHRKSRALGIANLALLAEVTRRQRAQEELCRARDQLEQKVRERTAEIEQASSGLEAEIAEHRRAEEALRQSEARLRLFLEHALDAFITIDTRGCVTAWNRQAEVIFGWDRAEAVGRKLAELVIPPRLRTAHAEGLARFLATGAGPILNRRIEVDALHRDGREFPVELSVTPVQWDGQVFFDAFVRDITEQRKAADVRSELAAIVESSDDAIIGKTLDGIITSWNPAAQRHYGYTAEEVRGKSISLLIPPEQPDELPEILQHLRRGEVPKHTETVRMRKDGSRVQVSLSVSPLKGTDGRVIGAASIARDITERKRSQMALETQAQELAEANAFLSRSNRDLDEFAYVASHDLREPLRGIHNYATFLLEDYADKLDAEGRLKLETLRRLSKRMDTLIDALLQFSRVGRTELAIQRTNLQQVLDGVLDLLRIRLEEQGVEIRVPTPLPAVVCDRVRIGEIFENLIVNAVKYNDKPERWVEIGMAPSASDRPEPAAGAGKRPRTKPPTVFYVRDNGIGIPERHREIVFRIFKRLHGRDKFGGGTGAGLTIVKKIVERHGGRIWIESIPGEGTTFFFTLAQEMAP